MAEQFFSKQEAIALLGCTVMFKNTLYFEAGGLRFPSVKAGSTCSVNLIENDPEGLILGLLLDEEYHLFNKLQFDRYCQVLPEVEAHASVG